MLRRAAVMAIAVLALVGCSERSRVDPNAAVRVHGTAVDTDGTSLADRPVRLGSGIGTDTAVAAVVTLGLSCAGGGCTGRVEDTTTSSDGSWSFTVRGRETQSTFGEALTQLVSTSAAPRGAQVSGASAWARFRVQRVDVALPALRLVDPHLGLAIRGHDVATTWTPVKPGPYELTFETGDRVPVWRATSGAPSSTIDERILEDTAGRAVVGASTTDQIAGSRVALGWRSPGVAYASSVGAPPSRGRPCTFETSTPPRGANESCELTDGDLVAPASMSPGATAVVIDLGRSVPAQLAVVRGCVDACAIDDDTGDGTWHPVSSASGDFAAVTLDGGSVTRVRVHLAAASTSRLREVSVWGPAPAHTPRAADIGDLRRAYAGGGDGGRNGAVVGAAAALLALALAGVAYAAGRRRTVHVRV
jgi:hypothetical protein